MTNKPVIVFDLDDTLIREIEFLESAFREIANKTYNDINESEKLYQLMLELYNSKENVFEYLVKIHSSWSKSKLISLYQNHKPKYSNLDQIHLLLRKLKDDFILGIITDGRSITQRNKLEAAKIIDYFNLVVISEEIGSEKPSKRNFEIFHQFKSIKYFYIGDNTSKDFITPNQLGWSTICLLDEGRNIHKQNFNLDNIYLPKYKISKIMQVLDFVINDEDK